MSDAPRRRGRHTKRTPERVQAICDVLRVGGTRRAACGRAEIDESTFLLWMDRFPEFSGAVERAEADAETRFTATLTQAAAAGDWRASLVWLERRRPKDWGPPKVRVDAEVEVSLSDLLRQGLLAADEEPEGPRLRVLESGD